MFLLQFRRLRALLAVAAFAAGPLAAAGPVAAQDVSQAQVDEAIEFARGMTLKATAVLTDDSLSESEQMQRFQEVLAESLALDVVGRFMLGENRRAMSEQQLARYERVFPAYITGLYADQFQDIVGRPLEVLDTRAIGERDVIVRSQFTRSGGAPIKVDWRVRKLRSGENKMIDIIVSGVSIMLVKRDEFSAFIARNGVDALLDQLERDASI